MSFFVQCALIFASNPYFLTIFLKYLLNNFGISSSIILLLSTNLIVILALNLLEKRCLTICQKILLSDINLYQDLLNVLFDFLRGLRRSFETFLSYNSKIISKSGM